MLKKEIRWIIRDKYGGDESRITSRDLSQLKKGEPVDYIIGWTPFLNCIIDLSKRPLIPRPETEYWVKKAIENIEEKKGKNATFKILDMCAGSGCIGVSVLKHFLNARMDFADIDSRALAQIKINLKRNDVLSRARVIHSKGFQNRKRQYDYIFANPPYISKKAFITLPESVKRFEPKGALWGGEDGLFFIKKFLYNTGKFLKRGGICYMEFVFGQKKAIERLLKKNDWQDATFQKDQYGKWRVLCLVK